VTIALDISSEARGWVGDLAGLWFVLQTKSRQEKTLAHDLQARGIGHYLPLVRSIRYYGKRKVDIELPMFPGYLFLRGDIDDAYTADRTGRVANILRVHDQNQLAWELRNISAAVDRGARLQPYGYLRDGARVEVRSGPFRGLQGRIEGRGRAGLLILQVNMLGRAVVMEIDGAILDPIDE
jgi:transcription antitermination factor NusG